MKIKKKRGRPKKTTKVNDIKEVKVDKVIESTVETNIDAPLKKSTIIEEPLSVSVDVSTQKEKIKTLKIIDSNTIELLVSEDTPRIKAHFEEINLDNVVSKKDLIYPIVTKFGVEDRCYVEFNMLNNRRLFWKGSNKEFREMLHENNK